MSEIVENLRDYRMDEDWISWMSSLLSIPREEVNRKVSPSVLIDGCCEDFAVFFCIKYGVPLWCLDDAHFLLVIDGKFYDGFNNLGVSKLKDLEFVKKYDLLTGRYRRMSEEEMRGLLKIDNRWKTYEPYRRNCGLIHRSS